MMTASLEYIDTFQESYDTDSESDDLSLESFIYNSGVMVESFDNLIKAKMAMKETYMKLRSCEPEVAGADSAPRPNKKQYVKHINASDYLLVVGDDLIFTLAFYEANVVGKIINDLMSIPAEATLNIIIDLYRKDLDFLLMFDGVALVNLIKDLPCKKVYNFGSMIGFVDLFMAMCCDEVVVSKYAAVSISEAPDSKSVINVIVPIHSGILKNTYDYWINKGLFTQDEVDALITSESENHICLLSPEIKARLNQSI